MKKETTPSGQEPCSFHFHKNLWTPFNSGWFRFQKEVVMPKKWWQFKVKKIYRWNCWGCWGIMDTDKLPQKKY